MVRDKLTYPRGHYFYNCPVGGKKGHQVTQYMKGKLVKCKDVQKRFLGINAHFIID